MSFETTPLRGVTAQYGAREVGGFDGVKRTSGITYEAAVNFDGDSLHHGVVLPAGAVVTNLNDSFATGAITGALVELVDISGAAAGTKATNVDVPLGGALIVTGPTAGTVIVEYEFSV